MKPHSFRMLAAVVMALVLGLLARPASAMDPTTADCLAANEAAITLGNQQKLRDERAKLLVCAATSCPTDVRAECARRVGDVNGAIPTIVFEARDPAGRDLVAVKVTMDGEVLAERLQGTALSIDPGMHAFAFEMDGQPPVQKQLLIREGEKGRRERILFGATVSGDRHDKEADGTGAAQNPKSAWGAQRIGAVAAAAAGVAGLGVGTGFSLYSRSKHDDAEHVCPAATCPDQHGVDLWNQARSAGNVATVAFIVGGVGLAGAVVLWLTAKPTGAASPAAEVALGPGTIQAMGRW